MARQQDTKAAADEAEAAAAEATDAAADGGEVEVTFHGQRGYPASYEFAGLQVGDRTLPWKQAVRMSQADADALKEAISGQGYRVSYSTDVAGADEDGEG